MRQSFALPLVACLLALPAALASVPALAQASGGGSGGGSGSQPAPGSGNGGNSSGSSTTYPIPARPSNPISQRGLWMTLDTTMKLAESRSYFDRYQQTREFAECAQRVTPKRVTILLSQPLASTGERRAANSLMRFAPGCLGHSLVVSTRFLRGAVAEAALEENRLADPDVAKRITSDRMEHFIKATPSTDEENDEVARALTKHTQCEVLLAPGLARKVVDATPDSAEEQDLRKQLAEETQACGEIEVDSRLAGLIHRSYLAEALYHWTRSNGDSGKS